MRNPGKRQIVSPVVRFFREALVGRAGVLRVTRQLVPVAVPAGRRAGAPRRVPSSRRIGSLLVVVGVALLAASAVCAAQPVLPPGVPNIYDPGVRAQFVPVAVWGLRGNPDFPMTLMVNTAGQSPPALLLGVDARNGKDTWSLVDDPIILIGVFGSEMRMQALYVDTGFVDRGAPSGHYAMMNEVNSPRQPDLLRAITAPTPRQYI
jgi:hypothetical protein